jgi:ketosteroid isomerase-like protein
MCTSQLVSLFRRWPSVEPGEQSGKLSAFGEGQGCQETALLLVQDAHGRDLGEPARPGRVDEEGPAVAGMALPHHVSLVFQVVQEGLAHGTVRGTASGRLYGAPATRRSFEASFFDYVRVEDGQIVERVQQTDVLGQMRQLYGKALGLAGLDAMFLRL